MSSKKTYSNYFTKGTPHTIKGAKAISYEKVQGKRVIHIKGAYYRKSVFDGTFELEEQVDTPFLPSKKGDRVKVICYWFSCRPFTTWPKILIENAEFKIEEEYSGEVVRNIGT
jgi:hypothetical protein